MLNSITTILGLLGLAAAVIALGWLSIIKKNLSELGMKILESEDIGRIKEAANKTESFESRVAGCEHQADENKNQLAEYKTKLSELSAKLRESEQKTASYEVRCDELAGRLESVKEMTNNNGTSLSQTIPSIKALADEIQAIKKFQTATEKAHSLIQAAFTDMQTSMPSEEELGTTSENAVPEETSQGPEEQHEEAEEKERAGSRPWCS